MLRDAMIGPVTKGGFDSLYGEHFGSIHRFISQFVHNAGLADELTQDTFVKALDGWDTYRGEAPRRIWLLRIARNVSLDYLRSPRSRQSGLASLDSVDGGVAGPADYAISVAGAEPPLSVEEAARQAEMTDCVRQFLVDLPETLRTPLVLHDVEELTNGQIAEIVGCSLEAAKMRLHRARDKLRQMMEARCDLFHDERNVLSCLPALPSSLSAGQHSSS